MTFKMTFKEIVSATFRLPAIIFGGIVALVLGDYARKKDGTVNTKGTFRGLLGLALDGAKLILDLGKAIGRTITNFIKNHQQSIASAFWLSLLVGGAAALTVALWPAALAAVAGFTIGGYSIASLVGTGFAAQVAATAGVATALVSAAVYTFATVANIFSAIKNCFTAKNDDSANEADFTSHDEAFDTSAQAMKSLTSHAATQTKSPTADKAPVHVASLLATQPQTASVIAVEESLATSSVGLK